MRNKDPVYDFFVVHWRGLLKNYNTKNLKEKENKDIRLKVKTEKAAQKNPYQTQSLRNYCLVQVTVKIAKKI